MQKTIAALFGAALLIVVAVLPPNAAGVTTETRDVVGQGRASEGARIVVAAIQPAAAIDNGFRGRYRVIALDDTCGFHSSWYRVRIRYVSERVRTYDRFAPGLGWPLRYIREERFPWQRQGGSLVELRYDRRTDTAIGIQQGPQCPRWRVRLVPIS